jgi:NarL family two-component system response regulator LiaR
MTTDKQTNESAPHRIRVMTVDDHAIVRDGIRFALMSTDDIQMVAEARNGLEALQVCEEAQPDVILMDIYLSGEMDGIAATRALRTRYPRVQVLALSSFHDRERVQGALQAGAIGYLIKDVTGLDLITAIRAAYAGQSTLSAEPLRDLVQVPASEFHPGDDLTEREREVLAMVVEGSSNAQIAEKLVVSVAAIKYRSAGFL